MIWDPNYRKSISNEPSPWLGCVLLLTPVITLIIGYFIGLCVR